MIDKYELEPQKSYSDDLRGPLFPRFLENVWRKIHETLRVDRSREVEQELSQNQNFQIPPSRSFRGHKGQ